MRRFAIISAIEDLPVLIDVVDSREEAEHQIRFVREAYSNDDPYQILPFVGKWPPQTETAEPVTKGTS